MAFIFALVLATATPAVPAEADAWGLRLARTGTLATLLPMMVAKDTEELVAGQTGLNDADRAALRIVAAKKAEQGISRVMAVEGHAYASFLSLDDLKALVRFNESAVSRHFRAAQPKVIGATMQGLAGVDFKKDVLTEFCKQTGKACPNK